MRISFAGIAVLVSVCLLPACGGADEMELEDAQLEEISQAQAKRPETGGACTIVKCSGLKDPFGTYKCDANGACKCERGTSSGTCDSDGNNCKEKCETTTSRPAPAFGFEASPDEVYADEGSPQPKLPAGTLEKLAP